MLIFWSRFDFYKIKTHPQYTIKPLCKFGPFHHIYKIPSLGLALVFAQILVTARSASEVPKTGA